MTKQEFSAGGIVLRRDQDKFLILVGQHSAHHGWVFPKGLIGDIKREETREETAIREVREETGILAKIIKPIPPVTYFYVFEGQKIRKTVDYFLMEYQGGDIRDHDFEMEAVEWLPTEKVTERLTYKGDREVWQEAQKLVKNFMATGPAARHLAGARSANPPTGGLRANKASGSRHPSPGGFDG